MASHPKSSKQKEVQRIADTLAKAIAQHRLKPGQRLVEAQIVETLNANRNHVQAALHQLALNKIVFIEPNRGATVAKPSASDARDVFTVRKAIELGIVQSITPDMITANQNLIDQHMLLEREATKSNDRHAIVSALSGFHSLLADICGNALFQEIFATLIVRSTLIVSLYQRNDIPSCASDEHQQVIDALSRGDITSAVAAMKEHLDELEDQLILDDKDEPAVSLSEALVGL